MSKLEVTTQFGGRPLTLETGRLAKQSDGSVLVSYGETVVLVTAVSNRELREGLSFFPLTVDFQEKYYASGKIPGGFFKREAKPSDRASLSARMVDRPIRPLFPKDYQYETQVVITILSTDGINDADVAAQIGASTALTISDIPWDGPIAGCRVGFVDGTYVLNPTPEEQETSRLDILVTAGRDGVVMVEGGAQELTEQEMMGAITFAHESIQPILDLQEELREKLGNPAKREYEKSPGDEALYKKIQTFLKAPLKDAFAVRDKLERYAALDVVKKQLKEKFEIAEPKTKEDELNNSLLSGYFGDAKAEFAREQTLSSKRIDGRDYNQVRPIHCEAGFLPRTHGTGLFTRGETQVMAAVTLGTADDEQKIDSIFGTYQKTFLLHYNFPAFSVGEARPMRPPGRREIGHGTLAERAIAQLMPTKEEFPYTVRVVGEVLESNGSSSMATVCSTSMALMDAGVPLKKPVAGVAMGMIKEGDRSAILTDILGDEDHLGDMDFKVCGTNDGITAFQMDLKIGSLPKELMEKALEQAREGRLHILGEMAQVISEPRKEFSKHAPRIHTLQVAKDKVREVIGPGGKVVRGIIEQTGVKIDIEDDGRINIASNDEESCRKAIEMVELIVSDPEPGVTYKGKVTRVVDFGAFVEILPGTEGLLHISELAHHRVRRVEDVVNEGDEIEVKCLEVDRSGKIRLSLRALTDPDEEGEGQSSGRSERPRRGGRRGEGRGDSRKSRSAPQAVDAPAETDEETELFADSDDGDDEGMEAGAGAESDELVDFDEEDENETRGNRVEAADLDEEEDEDDAQPNWDWETQREMGDSGGYRSRSGRGDGYGSSRGDDGGGRGRGRSGGRSSGGRGGRDRDRGGDRDRGRGGRDFRGGRGGGGGRGRSAGSGGGGRGRGGSGGRDRDRDSRGFRDRDGGGGRGRDGGGGRGRGGRSGGGGGGRGRGGRSGGGGGRGRDFGGGGGRDFPRFGRRDFHDE